LLASANPITVGHTAVTSTAQATAKLATATNPCPNAATATNSKLDLNGVGTVRDFSCVLHHNGPQSQTASNIGYWIGIHPYVVVPVLVIVALVMYFIRAARRARRPEPMSEAGMQNLAGAYLAGQAPDARGAYYYDV
jgi:hypothetical protein